MSISDDRNAHREEAQQRPTEDFSAKQAHPEEQLIPSIGHPDLASIAHNGMYLEQRSRFSGASNEQLAIELTKLAEYGVSDGRARDLLSIIAGRLARTVVSNEWQHFPRDKEAQYEFLNSEQMVTGVIVTSYILNRTTGQVHVFIADQRGNLIEERLLSRGGSEEYMTNHHRNQRRHY